MSESVELGRGKCPGCGCIESEGRYTVYGPDDEQWYYHNCEGETRYVQLCIDCPNCGRFIGGMYISLDGIIDTPFFKMSLEKLIRILPMYSREIVITGDDDDDRR